MAHLIKHITAVNNIYRQIDKCYTQLKKMFKNHGAILGHIEMSEKFFYQAILSIANKTEEIETKREFNKIVKSLKQKED